MTQFGANPDAAFLYTASILVTEFGDSSVFGGAHDATLMEMLTRFSEGVFARLADLAAFSARTEVTTPTRGPRAATASPVTRGTSAAFQMVEEFFFLVARFLEYSPSRLLASGPVMAGVVQCGAAGLGVDNRSVHSGIISCFHHLQ